MGSPTRTITRGLIKTLCWVKGFRKILCHSDSLLTLKLLKEATKLFIDLVMI